MKTKIVASLGPASWSKSVITAMAEAGVTLFRCNMSHMPPIQYRRIKRIIDQLNQSGYRLEIMADLQGHRLRIGRLPRKGLTIKQGVTYNVCSPDSARGTRDIPAELDFGRLHLKPGQPITMSNGLIEGEITAVDDNSFQMKAINSGLLLSRKGINLPESRFQAGVSSKDQADIAFVLGTGVDWVAASFVASAQDIASIRVLLGQADVKLMSKIERSAALDHLDDIVRLSDAVMVARGDLGIEIAYETVPQIQHTIIATAHRHHKPAVVATHMLYSLISAQRPTRAEVADIAAAVREGADGLLLADETAIGIDPVNAVQVMRRVVAHHENRQRQNYF